MVNSYEILIGKIDGRDFFGDRCVIWKTILKGIGQLTYQ
jgi:hypothetical protein